ncbi:MAG: hypothetical protein U5L75_03395 [Candidatus Campbellbacteria bacterium]|nr:hypothetical protein [Candidatus Campbellbacteria bacterium]
MTSSISTLVCALEREENAEPLERIDNATESNFGSFYDAWLGLYDRECDTSFSRLGWPNPEANEGLECVPGLGEGLLMQIEIHYP